MADDTNEAMPVEDMPAEESAHDAAQETPEPTYGNQAPATTDVAPEAPPPAGVRYAEDGRALITAEEYRTAVEKEYGRWVATENIDIDGVPAFRPGDPVPKSHVESGIVPKSSVVGRDTQTAGALYDDLNG